MRAEAAVAYAYAAGETDRVAELVGRHALATWARGGAARSWRHGSAGSTSPTTSRGIRRSPFCRPGCTGVAGRPSASEGWLALAEGTRLRQALPDGSASIEPWLAVVRAALCPGARTRMLADAELALERAPAGERLGGPRRSCCAPPRSPCWKATTTSRTRRWPRRRSRPRASASSPSRVVALSQRSLLAAGRGDGLVRPSLRSRPESSSTTTISRATSGSALGLGGVGARKAHRGGLERARRELERARALAPAHARVALVLGPGRLELAAGPPVAPRDLAGARMWLARTRSSGAAAASASCIARRTELERAGRAGRRGPGRQASTLTPAELRLLPLLTTYLSFREIGEKLFVSRNTVKTQGSRLRKLGVSSQSEAIERAEELGRRPRGRDWPVHPSG